VLNTRGGKTPASLIHPTRYFIRALSTVRHSLLVQPKAGRIERRYDKVVQTEHLVQVASELARLRPDNRTRSK